MKRSLVLVLFVVATASIGAPAHADAACAQTPSTGGDWASYGHDYSNTRFQQSEHAISATNAANLKASWTFSVAGAGGTGQIDGTPVEADGCVFVGTEGGDAYALNADTGALVWHTRLQTGVFSSLAVADGKVFANESITSAPYFVGPRTTALDEATGAQLWETVVNDFPGSDLYASPVVYQGLVITGVGANSVEGTPNFHGSVVFLDENNGEMVHRTWTIPPEVWKDGFSGGGVWGTMAIDPATGFGYTGTGNQFNSGATEYGTTNAIIKIDVDRARPTFGDIVATYKGLQDQYVASERQSCVLANTAPVSTVPGAGLVGCEFLDLDFGSSPNLWDDGGRLLVGANQKGVYHAADAATMAPVWTQLDGLPLAVTGATSCAVVNGTVYGSENPPGWVYALDGHTGARNWVAPHTGQNDVRHYEPTSVANGVVYQMDGNGILNVYDASSGSPLLVHQMATDVGATTLSTQSGGVSIARGEVLAAADAYLVAYHVA